TFCAIGTYSDVINTTTCKTCFPGSTTASTTATASSLCIADLGYYGSSGVFTQCAIGTYSDQIGLTVCKSCAAGQTTGQIGSNNYRQCGFQCVPGTYSSNGVMTSLEDCGAMTGNSLCTGGQSSYYSSRAFPWSYAGCQNCPLGYFQAQSGRTNCSACAIGSYADAPGSSSCTACPTFATNDILSSVTIEDCFCTKNFVWLNHQCVCPKGMHLSSYQNCTDCPAGTYKDSFSLSECQVCPADTYSSAGASFCSDFQRCPIATYKDTYANTPCLACPLGTYSNIEQSTFCRDCPVGYYTVSTGSSSGATFCTVCAGGSYKNVKSLANCSICGAGKYSDSGASVCINC
ncbi:hypothetical protein GUITHDRAFT_53913, partial [Guillardia theta CCMP2712]